MPTEFERNLIMALESVNFQPGATDKSFVRSVRRLHVDTALSDKQSAWLKAIAWKYRKQLQSQGIAVPEAWKGETHESHVKSVEDERKLAAWTKATKGDEL